MLATYSATYAAIQIVLIEGKEEHTQPFYGSLDFVRDNPGEPVPEETCTHSHPSLASNIPICFLHLLRSMTSSVFNPRALQSFSTISLQVFFGLPLGLTPSTSYCILFFTRDYIDKAISIASHASLRYSGTERAYNIAQMPPDFILMDRNSMQSDP